MTDPKRSERTGGGLVDRLVGRAREAASPENNELAREGRQAQERGESNKRAAAEATRRWRSAAESSAARSEKAIEERAKLGRLEHLDAKADALEEKEAALKAADEARRLRPPPPTRRPSARRLTVTMADRLSIYLNDHLAGSTVGIKLARRARASNQGTPLGEYLERLASEIESDRQTLERLMAELGIRPNRLKTIGAWGAEKLGRLKLNGQLTGYSPLSRFLELESLYLGITGKRELWRALQRALGNNLMGFHFDELERRAEHQAAEVEEHRLEAAQLALSQRLKPVARDQGKRQGPPIPGGR